MGKLTHADLFSLEHYARVRTEFRDKVIAHKKQRRLALGEHAALYFEDSMTMQYQVQEMLRLERIFEHEPIQAELDVYNPLIPDGSNWKATFMIEYADADERRRALAQMIGVEDTVWMKVAGCEPVHPVCNEDLDRSADDKTASVHFMRFELTPQMITALKQGAALAAGIDHPQYNVRIDVPDEIRSSLVADLA
jgi:hypothetical protein